MTHQLSTISLYAQLLDRITTVSVQAIHYPSGYFPESLLPQPKVTLRHLIQESQALMFVESIGTIRYRRLLDYLPFFVSDKEAAHRNYLVRQQPEYQGVLKSFLS